jgi:transcription elongation factor Elf1
MGMERIYTCNVCNNETEASSLDGFWFEGLESEPCLVPPEKTETVHICKDCQGQLSRALKQVAIDYTN